MMKILLLLSVLIFSACTSVKDSLTLKKKSSADEFLVEKKNPLVIPPDFGELPTPTSNQNANMEENEIEKLLTNKKDNAVSNESKSQSSSLEETILKKIK